MKILILNTFLFLFFLSQIELKGQDSCKIKFDKNIKEQVFIYKSDKYLNRYMIDYLHLRQDTIFKFSFYITLDENVGDVINYFRSNCKSLKSKYENAERGIYDTLVFDGNNKVNYINNKVFIDLKAPEIIDGKLLSIEISLNYDVFINKSKSPFYKNGCEYYKFEYISVMCSDCQYTYTYLKGFWVTEYTYYGGSINGHKYSLINKDKTSLINNK